MSEWDPRSFSAYLDAAMRNQGIRNDAELSRLSEIRQTQIGNWRNGAARPSMRLLRQLAKALNVAPNNLYVLAGWLDKEEPKGPDFGLLPPEIKNLIVLYDQMTTDVGRRQIREQIDVAVRGLQAKFAENDEPEAPDQKRAS